MTRKRKPLEEFGPFARVRSAWVKSFVAIVVGAILIAASEAIPSTNPVHLWIYGIGYTTLVVFSAVFLVTYVLGTLTYRKRPDPPDSSAATPAGGPVDGVTSTIDEHTSAT